MPNKQNINNFSQSSQHFLFVWFQKTTWFNIGSVDSLERNLENVQLDLNIDPSNHVNVIYRNQFEPESLSGLIPTLLIIGNSSEFKSKEQQSISEKYMPSMKEFLCVHRFTMVKQLLKKNLPYPRPNNFAVHEFDILGHKKGDFLQQRF